MPHVRRRFPNAAKRRGVGCGGWSPLQSGLQANQGPLVSHRLAESDGYLLQRWFDDGSPQKVSRAHLLVDSGLALPEFVNIDEQELANFN